MYYGGVELGGTKIICAVSKDSLNVVDKKRIPTTSPKETLEKIFKFFDKYVLISLGISSFGPIDTNKQSKTYGYITSTPKEKWSNFNLLNKIKERYKVPTHWTTDVNAAAYGEYKLGHDKNYSSCLYLTVGTGIGGGMIIKDSILSEHNHPEMGHIIIRKHPNDNFSGVCPFHENCLEGLASGTAIEQRMGIKGENIEQNNFFWDIESYYIAQSLVNFYLILKPEIIILGGSVMNQQKILPKVRQQFKSLINNYLPLPNLDHYIVSPKLEDDSGIIGSLLLAKKTFEKVN